MNRGLTCLHLLQYELQVFAHFVLQESYVYEANTQTERTCWAFSFS